MDQIIRDRSSERVLLLSLLFAGGYPPGSGKIALPNHIHLSTRRFVSGHSDSITYLMQERLIEETPGEFGDEQLRLTESGFLRSVEDAKAILKTRFFLGLHSIPEQGAVELTTQSAIASALLLFLYFQKLTFFDGIASFLGIASGEWADQAIQEFSARDLIRRKNFPRFQEDWYEMTLRGREVCELWLSGQPNVTEWPFRSLPLANRRHLPEAKISPVTDLDIRELGSKELELLAFEYARRELKLQNVRHPGGPYDGGADVLGEDSTQGGIRGVLLQSKQTSDNSLKLTRVKREFINLKVPDGTKPWEYILVTNAKDSQRLAEAVCEGTSKAGFSHSTIVSRTSLGSFLNQRENQDLIPRFFLHRAPLLENRGKMPRRSEWWPSQQSYAIEAILRDYFSEGGQLIVEDIEYEGLPSESFKASVMSFDQEGLLYGCTADGMLYRIPFQVMILWDEWTKDPIEGLPHLFVAGLDRIEPTNKSYRRSRQTRTRSVSSERSNSRKT